MSVYQNMNQFGITPLKGSAAALLEPTTISCQAYVSSTQSAFYAGQAVYLNGATGNSIQVDLVMANATTPFGYLYAAQRKDKFAPGDAVEVALAGSIIFLETGGQVTAGNSIEFVGGGTTVIAHNSGAASGISLDNAGASGTLIRVLVGQNS